MRALILLTAACSALTISVAYADTCTAPGHPTCTITCPNGCGAIYVEPNGPCSTFCSGAAIERSAAPIAGKVTSDLKNLSVDEILKRLSPQK